MIPLLTRLVEQAERREGILDQIENPEVRAMADQDVADIRDAVTRLSTHSPADQNMPGNTPPPSTWAVLAFIVAFVALFSMLGWFGWGLAR